MTRGPWNGLVCLKQKSPARVSDWPVLPTSTILVPPAFSPESSIWSDCRRWQSINSSYSICSTVFVFSFNPLVQAKLYTNHLNHQLFSARTPSFQHHSETPAVSRGGPALPLVSGPVRPSQAPIHVTELMLDLIFSRHLESLNTLELV